MRRVSWSLLLAVFVAAFVFAQHRISFAQTNLLQNPSFEEPYSNGAAANWGRWHEDTGKKPACAERYSVQPSWSPEFNSALILDGARSQHVGNQFDTWRGGVAQDINVTAGRSYRFSTWAWGRTTNDQYPAPSDTSANMRVRVGIDPTGSGLWSSSAIQWSGAVSPHDNWQQAAIEATATGSKITVFIEADFTGANQCRAHLDIWFDKAELIEAGPPPTATSAPLPTNPPVQVQPTATTTDTPEPTAVPTETLVPSPTPIPPTATPTGGMICVNAFGDNNANGQNDSDEGYMAGIRFTVARGSEIVGEGVSPGTDKAVCFQGLEAGSYQIAQTVPPALEMTTAGNITIDLEEGRTVGLEFGSRLKPQAEPTVSEETAGVVDNETTDPNTDTPAEPGEGALTPGDSAGFSLTSLIGLFVIGLAIVLLLALVGFLVYQQTRSR